MIDPSFIEPRRETPADPDIWEVEPLVVPYDDVLAPVVGHLEGLVVTNVGEGAIRFSGLDGEGRAVSGVMMPTFATGEDGRSIELTWEVDLTG